MIKRIELEYGQLYQLTEGCEIQFKNQLDMTLSTRLIGLYGFDIFLFLGRKMSSLKNEHAVILAKKKILFTHIDNIVWVKKLTMR